MDMEQRIAEYRKSIERYFNPLFSYRYSDEEIRAVLIEQDNSPAPEYWEYEETGSDDD